MRGTLQDCEKYYKIEENITRWREIVHDFLEDIQDLGEILGKYYKIEGNTRLRRILQVSCKIKRFREILLDSG